MGYDPPPGAPYSGPIEYLDVTTHSDKRPVIVECDRRDPKIFFGEYVIPTCRQDRQDIRGVVRASRGFVTTESEPRRARWLSLAWRWLCGIRIGR